MNTISIILSNLIFLAVGIILGYALNKKEKIKEIGSNLKIRLIKPDGCVIDSKEVNSLNFEKDDVNMHHNDFFNEL